MTKSKAIAALGALAQESRLDVFRLLVAGEPQGIAAGELGRRLKLPSPTLAFHLNQLRFAGLISSRRESRSVIYSVNLATVRGLMTYLTEQCCGGRPELCAPLLVAPTCTPGCAAPAAASSGSTRTRGKQAAAIGR